jgi:hypothetical protein
MNKRVDTHENFINKLDKDLALSDFEINILNDRLAEACTYKRFTKHFEQPPKA